MPFNFPFFRSQSNLLGNKKDNLEQFAAEDSKLRFDYEKKRQKLKEENMKNSEIEFFQKKFDFNLKEIDRRREVINKLDLDEKAFRRRMDMLIETDSDDPKQLEQNLKLSRGLDKKLEKIRTLRRHYNAEITHLEEQNIASTKKMS